MLELDDDFNFDDLLDESSDEFNVELGDEDDYSLEDRIDQARRERQEVDLAKKNYYSKGVEDDDLEFDAEFDVDFDLEFESKSNFDNDAEYQQRYNTACPNCGSTMRFEETVDDEDCFWCSKCGMDEQKPTITHDLGIEFDPFE